MTTRAYNGHVAVEIKNDNRDGPIPPELLPHIFEPFKRGTHRSASKTRSVGLGLFIVNHLVKAHEGQVEVRSNAQGTAFTVRLPRRRV